MKVLCPQCERLSELERFQLAGDRLVVTCTRCGAETQVKLAAALTQPSVPWPHPSHPVSLASAVGASNVVMLRTASSEAVDKARAAAEADPFQVPAELCPKCIARRSPGAATCPQCGLDFSQLGDFSNAPEPWLADAWRSLLSSWGDDARHEALRREALAQNQLAMLGRLYRLRLAEVPDDPYALRGREELLKAAAAPVLARPDPALAPSPKSSVRTVALAVLLVVLLGVFALMLRVLLAGFQ